MLDECDALSTINIGPEVTVLPEDLVGSVFPLVSLANVNIAADRINIMSYDATSPIDLKDRDEQFNSDKLNEIVDIGRLHQALDIHVDPVQIKGARLLDKIFDHFLSALKRI